MAAFDDPEKAYQDFVDRQKMKRLGTAEEIAAAAVFLSSDEVMPLLKILHGFSLLIQRNLNFRLDT